MQERLEVQAGQDQDLAWLRENNPFSIGLMLAVIRTLAKVLKRSELMQFMRDKAKQTQNPWDDLALDILERLLDSIDA